jgi:gliding motility-associated-like protein
MKRILFLFFLVNSLFVKSQTILSDSVLGVNCYHDGSISLLITNVNSLTLNWFFEDTNLLWVSADTMSSVQFLNSNLDTLLTSQCGNYRLDFNGISRYYWLPCPLGILASHDNVKCFGDSTGMLKRVAHSGESSYNYEWFMNGNLYSSGFNDTLFDNLLVGSYKVIVTDSIGCTDSILALISSPSVLMIDTMHISDINCRGVNTGSIFYSVSGGKRYIASEFYNYYLIDGLDTVAKSDTNGSSLSFSSALIPYQVTFDSLFAGEYILCIVDSFGCVLDTLFEIKEPTPYETYGSTIGGMLICESDSGYFKIDNVIGDSLLGSNSLDFSFLYYPNDTIYVPSGEYDIYIYDSIYFCLDTVSVTCNALYEIEVYKSINHVDCFGDSTGDIVIDSILNGNAPYDIQWGSVNNYSLFAGTYSVHIVDSIGCLKTEVFVVSQANQINPNEFIYNPLCNGDANGSITIDPSGGTGILSYYWLNGTGAADSLYALSSGIYTLVVSDSLLCVDSFDFFLSEPDSLIISFSNFQDSLACYGEVIVLNLLIFGGTAPFSVLWNDGNTNLQRIIGAGNYSCTVMDANGCISSESLVIIEPELLSINLTYSEITCDEGAAASISINGGVEPIDVIWNTGETLMSIDSLWGTIYWVVVTDSCGNSASDTFQISPYLLETSVFYDDSTHVGDVEIDTCSSVGTFSYQWVDILGNVISNNNLTSHLCEGTYFVTANDNTTNCSVIDTLIATYYLPNGIIDETITTVLPDSNLWGNPPYSYFWDNGEILAHANICPGAHWVEVTDNFDCVVRADFDIDPLLIALDPSEFIIECNLENLDVDITATPSGGTGPYTYSWSNGSTENSINLSLSPGNYSVTIMDNNACIEDTSFVISTMSADCVPNVFTPNGDNINDTWNLENTFLYSDSKIKIYGRYGRLLFKSVGYSTPWDGKNENGNDVSEGAYFYHIEVGHDFDAIKGSVTIIR